MKTMDLLSVIMSPDHVDNLFTAFTNCQSLYTHSTAGNLDLATFCQAINPAAKSVLLRAVDVQSL